MMIKANIKMGLSSLIAAKQRSILALLGIVIGIGSVIAMVSVGIIVKENTLKQFQQMGTDYIVISKGWGGPSGEGAPELTTEQAEKLPLFVPTIKEATVMGTGSGNFSYQGKDYNYQAVAVEQDFLGINRLKLAKGRFISDLDVNMNYVVIGDEVAQAMAKNNIPNPIGAEIQLQDRLFTVIGVLEKAPTGGIAPFNANRCIFVPLSTYLSVFPNSEISNILARVTGADVATKVTQDIINYFKLRDPELSIEVQNAEQLIAQLESQMQMFTLLLGAIGSISLIVGGVGVMNVMLVSVSERKKEIGIRRAIGALQRDIQVQFLVESLVLCLLGGIIGLLIGVGASYFIAKHNGWEFTISSIAIIMGFGVSSAVGLFFGYFPARQAAKLDPIVALRS